MDESKLTPGKSYNIKVFCERDYIGSAVVRRVGAHHAEIEVTVLERKFYEVCEEAARRASNGFNHLAIKPRLGQLIQKSVWDLLDKEKNGESSDQDYDFPF